jgi:hypothetical protein
MANDLASGIKDPERNTLAPSHCTANVDRSVLTVVKIGVSVSTDPAAYRRTAEFLATRVRERASERIVAVVSAGATNGCPVIDLDRRERSRRHQGCLPPGRRRTMRRNALLGAGSRNSRRSARRADFPSAARYGSSPTKLESHSPGSRRTRRTTPSPVKRALSHHT